MALRILACPVAHDLEIRLGEFVLYEAVKRVPWETCVIAILVDPHLLTQARKLRDGLVHEPQVLGSNVVSHQAIDKR